MKRPHYAWFVCLGCVLTCFTIIGLGANVSSIFHPYIIEHNHFTNAQGAWIITIRSLFILIGMLTAAWACRVMGLRLICTLSIGLFCLSCLSFGLGQHFLIYCLGAALSGLGYSWGGMIPVSLLIDRWFHHRQGLALGIASAGSGFATILVPTPLTALIESRGLRAAFWCEGAIVTLIGLSVWLLLRNSPDELSLAPYGIGTRTEEAAHQNRSAPSGMTRRRWLLILAAIFLVGPATSLGTNNLGVLYSTERFAPAVVASLISVMGLCLTVGKILYGQLVDRMGGRRSNYLVFAFALAGFALSCLAYTGNIPLAFAAMFFYGLGLPVSCVSVSIWVKDCCGDQGYVQGLKWGQTIFSLGILLLGPIPGLLADQTGSYVPAFALFLGMMALSLILISWVYTVTGAGAPPAKKI